MFFSYIFTFLLLFSLVGLAQNPESVSRFLFDGAQNAVAFCIELCGGICLWSGVMELMEDCGLTQKLSAMLRPILRRLFPRSSQDKHILSSITENVSANLLGLGNAATPAGIRAAQGMARLSPPGQANDELCRFVVLNTASIQLIPSTIALVRSNLGAASAFDIMPAVWISSFIALFCGLLMSALLERIWE